MSEDDQAHAPASSAEGALDPDAARDLISEAIEDELDAALRARFDAALVAHPELRDEYEGFVALFAGARTLAAEPTPDLLPSVQQKLRERSRGRFYRDRFAELGPSGSTWMALAMVLLLIVLVVAASSWMVPVSP
ncbi:MAG: hypothetical protein AAF447_17530 [Myxococcota bacterium]